MSKPKSTPDADLSTPLAGTLLIPESDFREKVTAIFSVPKAELDEHIKNNPDPPQKRGRRPKNDK